MRIILTFFIIGILFTVSSVTASGVYAQYFKFQLGNPTAAIKVGDNFDVKVMINTNSIQTINGDALINFEPSKLTIDPALVKTGNFYTYFSANTLGGTTNKFLISSWEESVARPKSSSTDTLYATMTIKANSAGTATLSFDCTAGSEADSNINQASDSKDIINCSALQPLTINIGSASGPTLTPGPTAIPTTALTPSPTSTPSATATPRPTSTPVPTNTPKPTVAQLPRAGTAEITVLGLGLGTLLTVVGILFIL
ncbi:hypothetical protein HY945_04555 [Candidatus Gottesmanbacteria bacterium]|nr:hypothetical protein [Candidatus Gottesmanbacteria bacterium]